jgi:hypothetical protein
MLETLKTFVLLAALIKEGRAASLAMTGVLRVIRDTLTSNLNQVMTTRLAVIRYLGAN